MPTTDEEWLQSLWTSYAGHIMRYASRRVGRDAAQDVVADTFVVAWRNRLSRPANELPWLYGVARRVVASLFRSEERSRRLTDALAQRQLAGDGHLGDSRTIERLVAAEALRSLSEPDREVLLLMGWEGLSPADAAAALGISSVAYRARLSRARRRLSQQQDRVNTLDYQRKEQLHEGS